MNVQTMEALYRNLSEIVEADDLKREAVLADLPDWDSLTALSVISAVMTEYDVTITGEELSRMKTVGDIEDLVVSKLAR